MVKYTYNKQQRNFISRNVHLLKDGGSTFRFLLFNIPDINLIEDEMAFTKTHPFRLPTSFEIRDVYESVKPNPLRNCCNRLIFLNC